ncbi:MAG TPA: response regulator transcription factor [Thermoanaerobaculia bacterium]|nr:response regulator transcription factor [Thermoanaerobaculia bacterium]
MPISLLLADDHPIVLDGLEQLFRLEEDFRVLGRCLRGEEVASQVIKLRPDVLVLDMRMPGHDGLAVLRELKNVPHQTRVVILAATLTEDEMLEAMRLGVRGIVLKEMAPRLLVECIRKVHGGGQWLEKTIAGAALDRLARREGAERQLAGVLTPREVEIARSIGSGRSNREIADALFISEGTVKTHLHRIYEKLNIHGRLELGLYARDKGLT